MVVSYTFVRGVTDGVASLHPALGQYGLNIVQFCKEYNAATEKEAGDGVVAGSPVPRVWRPSVRSEPQSSKPNRMGTSSPINHQL